MRFDGLTATEMAVCQWQYKACGEFKRYLWEAIARADDRNLDRLALGFPVEVEGFRRFQREEGWWNQVEIKFLSAQLKTPPPLPA